MAESNEIITSNNPDILARTERGIVQTDAMAGEISRTAELGVSPLEAQARAMVQARFFIAQQPNMQRNWDAVEQKLRKECVRPGFAWAAYYVLPVGRDQSKWPTGLSIRFAEAALRLAKNIDIQQTTIFDDDWKRIVRVSVIDLENNFGYTAEIPIDKTVERQEPKDRQVLSARENSSGRAVYTVAATEQELAMKQGSAVSKAIRTLGLRLLPGDILDECKSLIETTRKQGNKAVDPELQRKTLLDDYAAIGVLPTDIAKFVGHDTATFQPAEFETLRGLYIAIKDNQTTWAEIMKDRDPADPSKQHTPAASALLNKINDKKSAGKAADAKPAETAKTVADQKPEETKKAVATGSGGSRQLIRDLAASHQKAAWRVIGSAGYDDIANIPEKELGDMLALIKKEIS